jgi:hypothetical protein
VDESPIAQLLGGVDELDVDAAAAMFAGDGRLLTVDGRRAQGREAVRDLLRDFLAALRSSTHRITAQWQHENVWIAEVEATYELRDWRQLTALPRAFVLRDGPAGIADLRVYGSHERPLGETPKGEKGTWIGERWMPPL